MRRIIFFNRSAKKTSEGFEGNSSGMAAGATWTLVHAPAELHNGYDEAYDLVKSNCGGVFLSASSKFLTATMKAWMLTRKYRSLSRRSRTQSGFDSNNR